MSAVLSGSKPQEEVGAAAADAPQEVDASDLFMALSTFGEHRATLASRLANAHVSTAAANRVLSNRGVGSVEYGYVPSYFVDGDGDGEEECPVLSSTAGLRIEMQDDDNAPLVLVPHLRDFPTPPEMPTPPVAAPASSSDGDDAAARRLERQRRLQQARAADRQRGMHNPVHWFVPGGSAVPQELAEAQKAWRGVVAAAVDTARARIGLDRIATLMEESEGL
jgi:hypothetical protein